jgi:hypothetical protein
VIGTVEHGIGGVPCIIAADDDHPGPCRLVDQVEMRRFELHRDIDETGVSGVGIVAEGVCFSDGVVALRWRGDWPTSVVFHDRGMEAVEAVHGHGGKTRIVWVD